MPLFFVLWLKALLIALLIPSTILSVVDENEKIDDVVCAVYKGPKSFTGEDSVEIICHGSMLIANQIIETLLKNGATNITQNDYNKLIELIDETRTAKNIEIEK